MNELQIFLTCLLKKLLYNNISYVPEKPLASRALCLFYASPTKPGNMKCY